MKKILFVVENFKVGGVQKSLVNLLRGISDEYEIDVLPFDYSGDYLCDLPSGIKIVHPPAHYRMFAVPHASLKGSFLWVYKLLFGLVAKLINKGVAFGCCSPFYHPEGEYDVAISFSHSGFYKGVNGICPEFVLSKTKAKKKICFIHCDYQNSGTGCIYNNKLYEKFDQIACCSDSVRKVFLKSIPHLAAKTVTVRNLYDSRISDHAMEDMKLSGQMIHIFTVARLSKEKGVDRAVLALSHSKRKDICYYIIGDGSMKEAIRNLIHQEHLEDQVFLMGADAQPYSKLMNADYLLVPSYNEAAPMVFDEATVLNIPIISTDTTSAREMLSDSDYICENSIEGMKVVLEILEKPQIKHKKSALVNNDLQIKQFQEMLEM